MRISRGGTKVRDRAAKGAAKVVRVRSEEAASGGHLHLAQEALVWCLVTAFDVLLYLDSQGIKFFCRDTIS